VTEYNGSQPMRVLVCGTKFGQVYLEALRTPTSSLELVGVLARGSSRSEACARYYGAPLYTKITDLPADIDAACVVVRAGLLGGQGSELALELIDRGIHVLQEHPAHHDELAACLRHARRRGVVYRMNSFYVYQQPVREFLAAARVLLAAQPARYVDAACGFQVAFALLDIVGTALGGVRPWAFAEMPPLADSVRTAAGGDVPFRSLDGVVAGVPFTLRVHNQLDPADPDNYAHLLHRVTIGTDGGSLTLVGTHGPLVWSPRPDFPRAVRELDAQPHFAKGSGENDDRPADYLDVPTGMIIKASADGYRRVFQRIWPAGVRHALEVLRADVLAGGRSSGAGQYYLSVSQLWQEITGRLGPPKLISGGELSPLGPVEIERLVLACAQVEDSS
jgi:pyochelin biosynthesis protein PchG